MIRKIVENQFDSTHKYVELACLSTDTKPTGGMVTGSLALEVNTGDIYAYDEVGESWSKITSLGGDEEPAASVSDSRSIQTEEQDETREDEPEVSDER